MGKMQRSAQRKVADGPEKPSEERDESLPRLLVTCPIHDGKLHYRWVAGALDAKTDFAGRIRFDVQIGSFLPRNRDLLTSGFLRSDATHMLCIDSDIGWRSDQIQKLIDADRDFVSGVYCKKNSSREIPAHLTGKHEGDLYEAEYVPAGFMLLRRAVIERMVEAYADLHYTAINADHWALWSSLFEQGASYDGEDVAFCRRWRKIGGQIWIHRGVVVDHYGDACYQAPSVTEDGEQKAIFESMLPTAFGETSQARRQFIGKVPVYIHEQVAA